MKARCSSRQRGFDHLRCGQPWRTADWLCVAAVMLAGFFVFLNAFDGAFVYDDEQQIVANRLISTPGLEWQALTSDVWAFKTSVAGAAAADSNVPASSNYYRPAFMLLLIVEHRLFGLDSTRGWHAVNALLHAIVCGMAYLLARRLGLGTLASFAACTIFAVHPAHVETVAWISGSPDLLLSIGVLAAMLSAERIARRGADGPTASATKPGTLRRVCALWPWVLLVLGYALAITSKEMGILAWAPVAACAWQGWHACGDGQRPDHFSTKTLRNSAVFMAIVAVPGVLMAAVFWYIRGRILGDNWNLAPGAASWESVVLSVPSVALFYLRQAFWPWEGLGWLHATGAAAQAVAPDAAVHFPGGVGAAHPVRAVTAATMGLWNFYAPLAICILSGLAMLWAAFRSRSALVGLMLFGAMLAPAFNLRVFPVEHIVRDRYLYLPLLGVLFMLAGPIELWLRSRLINTTTNHALSTGANAGSSLAKPSAIAGLALAGVLVAAVIGMVIKTVRTNEIWKSNLGLWQAAARSDPTSAHAHAQLGLYLSKVNKLDEALAAYERAYTLSPMVLVSTGRAMVSLKLGDRDALAGRSTEARDRYSRAEADARLAISSLGGQNAAPDSSLAEAYEHLGTAQERQRKLPQAAETFAEASSRLPFAKARFAGRQAVVLYQMNDKAGARRVLEGARAAARTELNASATLVLQRLGMLYLELGRQPEALEALTEFVRISRDWAADPEVGPIRADVISKLKQAGVTVGP